MSSSKQSKPITSRVKRKRDKSPKLLRQNNRESYDSYLLTNQSKMIQRIQNASNDVAKWKLTGDDLESMMRKTPSFDVIS